jgi:hypothetical protein
LHFFSAVYCIVTASFQFSFALLGTSLGATFFFFFFFVAYCSLPPSQRQLTNALPQIGRWAVVGGIVTTWLLAEHGAFRNKFMSFLPLRLKDKSK